jgi:hypothetical protein
MPLQLGALRDALINAGAQPEKAAKAVEKLAVYDSEFAGVRQELVGIRGDINLLRWMVGANFALTVAVFVKLFVH